MITEHEAADKTINRWENVKKLGCITETCVLCEVFGCEKCPVGNAYGLCSSKNNPWNKWHYLLGRYKTYSKPTPAKSRCCDEIINACKEWKETNPFD